LNDQTINKVVMKNRIYKFIICGIALVLVSCNHKNNVVVEAKEKECCKKDAKANTEVSKEIPEESVFNITTDWKNQNDNLIKFNSFAGKITIAAMVFTHCESACPRIVADIQRIEKSFTSNELKQINFVLISMDPERDTPERFREFSKEHQLNSNWTLISSSEDATMEMANVLNVRVKKLSGGGFDHSNTIHVLNQQGLIVYQQNGLEQEPEGAIKNIKTLLQK